MIELKSSEEIEKMLASGKIVSKVLKTMQEEAVAGVSTWRLDQIAEEIRQSGTDCDDVRPDMFNLLLAEKIENMIETFLQQSSSSRTEVEVAIAEKTVRLAKMYECHHQALPEKGEM